MKALEEVQNHLKWCNDYIEHFTKTHEYNPFKALTEQESKEQEMFTLCCNYIYGIENSLDKVNKAFEAERNSIAFKDRRTA